jgi:type VI secretion system protein ImpH
MASAGRRGIRPLIERLEAEPYRFDSRQAIRVLELNAHGTVPVGLRNDPSDEAVAFRSSLSSAFPASDIDRIEMPRESSGGRSIVTVNFLGLGGAFGPLPVGFTELVAMHARQGDTASCDFLDIFNHRLVSMMMRAWRLFRVSLQDTPPEETNFAFYLFALLGLGTEGMRIALGRHAHNRLDGLDRSLLGLTGLLNQRPLSLHAVERTLTVHFALPARAIPLRGVWLQLESEQWTAIGGNGRNQALGAGAVLGARVWDQEAGILIALGPMGFREALAFMPAGTGFGQMRTLLGYMLGGAFDARLQLTIRPQEMPSAILEKIGFMRLGWTAWLTSRPRSSPGIVTIVLCASSGNSEAQRCATSSR